MDDEYIAELLEYVGVEGTDDFAKRFDHTNLHPFSGERQIRKLCEEASEWGFATVCVAPRWIVPAMEIFDEIEKKGGRRIPVCTVIGFPHGDNMPGSKISEAREAAGAGATEIDMVLAIGELIAGRDTPVHDDIEGVCKAAHAQGAIVKVIVETAYLLTPRITISADE
jgi:deoxyribose-phosphate aldolase